jgi:hypothetical protein
MDKVYQFWNQDNSKPLLVHASSKAGKSIAAEHIQLGKRVCVITTSGRMVRALTCRIAARSRQNGLLAATIDGYDDDAADQHAMLTNNNNDGWMRCIVGKAHDDDGIDHSNIIAKANTILVDDAPYVDPAWFRDRLLPRIQTTPSVVFGTPTLETNHFTLMCNAERPTWRLLLC